MSTWTRQKLSDICDVRDGTHDSPKPAPFGHPLVTSKHIINNKINLGSAYLIADHDFVAVNKRSRVDKDDILISMIGTVGEVALVRENPIFAIKNVGLIKTHDEILGKYLYYYLISPTGKNTLESLLSGSTQKFISLSKLRDFPINLPTRDYQVRIASVLSSYDDLIENNEKRIRTLEEMAQLLYTEWFAKFKFPGHERVKMRDSGTKRGLIPDGWDVVKIGSFLGKVKRIQKIQTSEYLKYGQFPIVDQGREFIAGYTNNTETVYKENLIVFGDHSRCFKYCNFPFACGADGTQLLLTNDSDRMPETLLYYLVLNAGLQNYSYARHYKFLKVIEVVKPDSLTATRFDTVVGGYFEQIRLLRDINLNLSRTRDLLIPQLVTSKRELK